MDARDWYYTQPVSESELDEAFEAVEAADLRSEVDKGQYGILYGFQATEDGGGPSMSIEVSAGAAIDKDGHRLFSGGTILQDITNDTAGTPTAPSAANRRWVSIYARFGRDLSDPRVDGLANPLYFKHNEALNSGDGTGTSSPTGDVQLNVGKLLVIAGAEDLIINPLPARPAIDAYSSILICDVLYTDGDTSFDIPKISTGRAQRFAHHFLAALPDVNEFDGNSGTGKNFALIMEASGGLGAGAITVFNRVYMSNAGLVFTHNARWEPETRFWVAETTDPMTKIHLGSNGIKIFRTSVGTSFEDGVTDWDAEMDLNAFGLDQFLQLSTAGTFEQEGVTHCLWGHSYIATAGSDNVGGAFTYNIPFTGTPSSVTETTVGSDTNVSGVVVTGLNAYGGKGSVTTNSPSVFTSAMRLITATF